MIDDIVNTKINDFEITYKRITKCPSCGASISDKPVFVDLSSTKQDTYYLYTLTECHACSKPFFTIYFENFKKEQKKIYKVHHCYYPPYTPETEFDKRIAEISPDFIDIYHEAETAEANGLLKICGAGFRKAFEFLIKDYVIKLCPQEKENIIKEPLSRSVGRLPNGDIKTSAQKCSWIGNDKIHYFDEHPDKTIDDLKELIQNAAGWIVLKEVSGQDIPKIKR